MCFKSSNDVRSNPSNNGRSIEKPQSNDRRVAVPVRDVKVRTVAVVKVRTVAVVSMPAVVAVVPVVAVVAVMNMPAPPTPPTAGDAGLDVFLASVTVHSIRVEDRVACPIRVGPPSETR